MRLLVTTLAVVVCLTTASCTQQDDETAEDPTTASATSPSPSAASPTGAAAYDWVNEDGIDVAHCVGVFPGATRDEVLRSFGVDTSRVLDSDSDADFELAYGESIAVTEVAGGVVTVEPNGFQCSMPEVLTRAAGRRPAASVFWNVEADNAFTLVRPGEEAVSVDLYDAEYEDTVEAMTALGLPADLFPLWQEAGDPEAQPWAAGLAMAEEVTGVVVPREAVDTDGPLYFLPS